VTCPGASGPAQLLPEAVGYAVRAARQAVPRLMGQPTPCQGWDLRMLLRHCAESLAALQEAIATGHVSLAPGTEDAAVAADPVAAFRSRAAGLLRAYDAAATRNPFISIAGHCLPLDLAVSAGALEIAMHGWDISRACGQREPVPCGLAARLLDISALLVPLRGRAPLFAAPVSTGPAGCHSDRLAAWLGRDPAA
jgi:uncharacterized protein (TIGR03086 family)